MGFIKEPKGVDFIIESKPLTDTDRQEISTYIADYKKKHGKRRKESVTRKSDFQESKFA